MDFSDSVSRLSHMPSPDEIPLIPRNEESALNRKSDSTLCAMSSIDWTKKARQRFAVSKPQHFTDFQHCPECAEHDETLLGSSIDQIGIRELGNPGWDPMCFCSAEGIEYYFPALIRLTLATASNEDFYFCQLLFHLEYGGKENRFLQHCSGSQREFVAAFIEHMITTYPDELEENMCATEALNTYELWKCT